MRNDAARPSDRSADLLGAEFPVFSQTEMRRRRNELAACMDAAGARSVLLSGGDRKGSAIQWLTGWPATQGHFVVFTPGEQDVLVVKNPNNAPLAKILAPEADVRWSPDGPLAPALEELARRCGSGGKTGVIGSYSHALHEKLVGEGLAPLDMSRDYTRLRLVKSAEELDWLRVGCMLTDRAVAALEAGLAPGLSEHEIADLIERAYVPLGGMTQIHYTGATSMAAPDCCVPSQLARNRRIADGDAVFTEISASFWSYPGQIQRTFTLNAPPTPLYRDLHAAADEAFARIVGVLRAGVDVEEILDAAGCIAAADFTICDDLFHGYGGGYLPPVLGTRERPSGPVPRMKVEENMTVVVQPSVTTKDGRAGVQTGELVRIARDGVEFLHRAPKGLRTIRR